jgi:hypothetical protein
MPLSFRKRHHAAMFHDAAAFAAKDKTLLCCAVQFVIPVRTG